ncbi:hypothetical protein [Neisseria sp.]|uniref:hypothetical protein n=1 Tax=Neisseria sp. TaxID=192066 RepID=UPI0035A0E4D2
MNIRTTFILTLPLVLAVAACVKPHTYVSPDYRKHSSSSLSIPAQPHSVRLETAFLLNGKPAEAANRRFAAEAADVLNGSSVVRTSDNAPAVIKLTAATDSQRGKAAAKGLATGLTFGLAGNRFDDNYRFECSYNDGTTAHSETYNHAVTTVIGNKQAPQGTPVKTKTAFADVTAQIVTNCLVDLQQKGFLR